MSGGNSIGASVASTLELAPGTSSGHLVFGTLDGIGGDFVKFADITIDAGAAWYLASDNSLAHGAVLDNAGTLQVAGSLGNAGSISGFVGVLDTGTLSNAATGVISSQYNAVGFAGGAASFANAGIVTANNIAVDLALGGTVSNQAHAAIVAGATANGAVFINGRVGSIANAGTISGGGGLGVDLTASGMVTNPAGGVIYGATRGVEISGFTTTATAGVSNAGTIGGGSGAGVGVSMAASGYVSNTGTGLISAHTAVYFGGLPGTVVNAATIAGGFGVQMRAGGWLTNLGSGIIQAGDQNAIYVSGFAGTVSNAGSIGNSGSNYSAIYFRSGGSVDNAAGGVIASTYHAIDAAHASLAVSNAGTIANTNSAYSAIALDDGGSVVNAAGGTIVSGYHGIYISGGGTITNAGTIGVTGVNTIAIDLVGGFANRVVADPGAVFAGAVQGGNFVGGGAVSVLELAPGAGTLAGIGPDFQNFGSIQFDPGAAWTIAGSTAGLAGGETIGGFTNGQTIELVGVSETIGAFAGGTLSLTGTDALDLLLPGSFNAAQFHAATTAGNTDISVACFVAGARILTDAGEVEVERLRPGARVVSLLHRKLLPVVWIGCRKLSAARPVRVRADAFGAGRPHRDLWLSPDHAVFVDGALVPVRLLVNGASIAQHPRDEVFYYHVELAEHGVLLAEGLPAESYLDTGNRSAFANRGAVVRPPREKEPACR